MRAMAYDHPGGPEVLREMELPKPGYGPDEVLIRVRAAGVNPVDWILRRSGSTTMDVVYPVVPGWDVAGVVEEVGADAREHAVGDEVIGYLRRDHLHGGTLAEYVVSSVRALGRKPASLSWEEAAGLPLAGLTAYQLLVHRLEVSDGDVVLIHAAAGGVGSLGAQIAIAHGARVIGTASEGHHAFLRALGVEPVAYGDGLTDRVRALAPAGVDVAVDLIGGETLDLTAALMAPGGRLGSIVDPRVKQMAGGVYHYVRPDRADLAALADLADAGRLRVPVSETFPLERAGDAHQRSAEGHVHGKLVVQVS
jgi:NADPH:quinone reductase-like Zn-dependent oxidoreductase